MKSGRIRFEKFLQRDFITITVVEAFILLSIALLTLGINQVDAAADLVETHVSNPPPTTTEGGKFWVIDTVQNKGTDIAPPSVTRYYLSTTGIKDTNSILLSGMRSVASLKPRQRSGGWASVTVTVPLETPIGIYYLVACADDTGVVDESDETNNCISSTKTVQLIAPDLVETSVTDPPPTASAGDSFSVTDTVKNQGNRTSTTSMTRYYLSSSGVKDNGAIIGKRSIPALTPGKSSKGTVIVGIPSSATKDIYYLVACADDTGVVNESDKTNNCISSTKTVQLTAPDLVETSVTDPPATASAGDSFSVTDTVENQGDGTSLASTTRYYLSSSGVRDNGAILLIGKRSIPTLTPGVASTGTVTVEIPPNATEDMYYLLACADDTNKIAESNEQNNCITSSKQVTLSSPPNVLPVTVNGSLCSADSYLYPNKPCVSVTICIPNSTTCQTIDDILLDTGSSGLRIFKQVLGIVSLPQKMVGSSVLAECIQYGDGSSNWGPVAMADIILGNEPAVQAPIQIIDATFGTLPSPCLKADSSPTGALYSGILGVGLFAQDCGPACANESNNGMYYACAGLDCTGTTVSLSDQVPNPVALLPVDNNGVVVQIPAVPSGGSISVDGQLLLGIGTRSNNMPSAGVVSYAANQDTGYFFTNFYGRRFYSFIDTGSNGLFFPPLSSLPDCGLYSGWFCPSYLVSLSATNRGAYGSPGGVVSFQIANFSSLMSSPNNVFPDIGGDDPGEFDWGLPFHLGRYVYVGIESKSSVLGTGPYWGY